MPNAGESWTVGSDHNITWTTTGTIANVKLEYSTNSGSSYSALAASIANTGSYSWTIPNIPSSFCQIRVSDASNPSVFDVSDAPFAIGTTAGTTNLISFGSLDNGNINIGNIGAATASLSVKVFDSAGQQFMEQSPTVPPNGVRRTWDLITNVFNYGKPVSLLINGTQPLVGDNIKWAGPPYDTVGAGFTCGPVMKMKGREFFLPFNSSVTAGEWANGYCVLSNTTGTTANVMIIVYDQNGTLKKTAPFSIPAFGMVRSWDYVGSIQDLADPALLRITSDQDVVVEAVRWVQNRRGWDFAILPISY
jgi:hypothetical protein